MRREPENVKKSTKVNVASNVGKKVIRRKTVSKKSTVHCVRKEGIWQQKEDVRYLEGF